MAFQRERGRTRLIGGLAGSLRVARVAVLAALAAATASYFALMVHADGGASAVGTSIPPSVSVLSALQQAGSSKLVSRQGDLQVAEFCAPDHAEELANQFLDLSKSGWTSCSDTSWLNMLEEISDPHEDRYFVDIGCNKGYVSAHMFGLFAPELAFSPSEIKQWKEDADCGACADCREEIKPFRPHPEDARNATVRVLCVEPNTVSFSALVMMREHFFPPTRARINAHWDILNAAISNTSLMRTAAFPRCSMGNEVCGLTSEDAKDMAATGVDIVPVYGVDELLGLYGLQYVDVLKMDTEGFDAPSIISGISSLYSGMIGILAFEYHGKGEWARYSLSNIVELMDGLNFVCYFSGKQGPEGSLARLTGCWSSVYEYKTWSNVVCIKRTHDLYPHAERATLRYRRYQQQYYRDADPTAAAVTATAL